MPFAGAGRDPGPTAPGITAREGKERRVRRFPKKILLATDGAVAAGATCKGGGLPRRSATSRGTWGPT